MGECFVPWPFVALLLEGKGKGKGKGIAKLVIFGGIFPPIGLELPIFDKMNGIIEKRFKLNPSRITKLKFQFKNTG